MLQYRWLPTRRDSVQAAGENHAIAKAKDGSVGADAQGQRQDDYDRESWPPTQTSEGKPQVAPQCVEEGNRIHFVDGLANPMRIPQLAMGSGPSVCWRHASFDVAVCFYLDVRFKFSSTLAVPVFAAKETHQTHGIYSEYLLDCRPENASNRLHQLIPPIGLRVELFPSRERQPIVAGAAIIFRSSPERSDPAAILKPMERGVKRAVLDLKNVF
jgi:hypothetical protein